MVFLSSIHFVGYSAMIINSPEFSLVAVQEHSREHAHGKSRDVESVTFDYFDVRL